MNQKTFINFINTLTTKTLTQISKAAGAKAKAPGVIRYSRKIDDCLCSFVVRTILDSAGNPLLSDLYPWNAEGETIPSENGYSARIEVKITIARDFLHHNQWRAVIAPDIVNLFAHEMTHLRENISDPYDNKLRELIDNCQFLLPNHPMTSPSEVIAYMIGIKAESAYSHKTMAQTAAQFMRHYFPDETKMNVDAIIHSLNVVHGQYVEWVECIDYEKITC